MLCSLENYYWRYCSASELVNMILAFIETRALAIFHNKHFLSLSESMVQMIMSRNLEIPELHKFEAMLKWANNKVRWKESFKKHENSQFIQTGLCYSGHQKTVASSCHLLSNNLFIYLRIYLQSSSYISIKWRRLLISIFYFYQAFKQYGYT